MEILFEILEECADDILELLLKFIKMVFRFITKTLIPGVCLAAANAKHKRHLRRFNGELELKAENTDDDKSYFDEKHDNT